MRAFIGATEEGGVQVALSRDGRTLSAVHGPAEADLLALFESALKRAKAKKTEVKEIVVDRGPAGFSAVRRRVAVATALSRALKANLFASGLLSAEAAAAVPSSAFGSHAQLEPLYTGAPHITISKKPKLWSTR